MFKAFTMKFTGKLAPSLYSVQDIAKGCLDFDHQGTKIVWWSSDVSSLFGSYSFTHSRGENGHWEWEPEIISHCYLLCTITLLTITLYYSV